MRQPTNERELLDLEREFWNAMLAKDARRAQEMTDDQCIIVGAQGVSAIDGPTMAQLTKSSDWTLEDFEFDEESTQVQFLGRDVAIVAYKVDERVRVNGETIPIEANDSSVWVRRDGEWRCALHTESIAGDPLGRDRTD
jgi:hypothetical protein